jgi:hypothetical protein
MSDMGFGNVDLTALDQMLASLGQQSAPTPAAAVPTFADNPGQARIQAEREAAAAAAVTPTSPITPVTPVVTGGADGGGGDDEGGETAEERAIRLANEREDARDALAASRRRQDARSTINSVLATYGLGGLADFTYNEIIVKETVNINNPDAIIFALREQPTYKKRFAGNAARLKAGLAELDPASYIGLENQFRETLRSNGLPANFYDGNDDFQALIEGDVSPSELNERVQQGYRAVADADPEVKRQMQNLYGVDEGQLAAYFLDPQRTAPLLTRQARAAQISARGLEQGGIQLTSQLAEDLVRRGITEAEAARGFGEIGRLGELTQQFAGETSLSQEELVGAGLGTNVQAQQELERRKRLRLGEFQGGGTFAKATGDVKGSTQLGIGSAQ